MDYSTSTSHLVQPPKKSSFSEQENCSFLFENMNTESPSFAASISPKSSDSACDSFFECIYPPLPDASAQKEFGNFLRSDSDEPMKLSHSNVTMLATGDNGQSYSKDDAEKSCHPVSDNSLMKKPCFPEAFAALESEDQALHLLNSNKPTPTSLEMSSSREFRNVTWSCEFLSDPAGPPTFQLEARNSTSSSLSMSSEDLLDYSISDAALESNGSVPVSEHPFIEEQSGASLSPTCISKRKQLSSSVHLVNSFEICSALESGNFAFSMSLLESMSSEQLSELSFPDKRTPLHYACLYGRVDIAKQLITEYKYSIRIVDVYGNTPLHIAAKYGHTKVIKSLLNVSLHDTKKSKREKKELLNYKNLDGNTLLHVACLHGQLDVMFFLISEIGFSPKETNKQGQTSFDLAAQYCHTQQGEVSKTATALTGKNKLLFLYLAIRWGHLKFFKYIIVKKYSLLKDGFGKRLLLDTASKFGHLDILMYLIEQCGCDPFSADDSAGIMNSFETVPIVSSSNQESFSNDTDSTTPLHLAAGNGHLDIVKYFTEKLKINPELKDGFNSSPLHYAALHGRLEVVKFLIEHMKCCRNCKDKNGRIPLHYSSYNGHLGSVQYLVEGNPSDSLCRDHYHSTPLHLSACNGKSDVTKYLATLIMRIDEIEPLLNDGRLVHHSASKGHLEVVKFFVEVLKYDVYNIQRPTFDLACQNSHLNIVKYLSNYIKTALHMAAASGHLHVVRLLVEDRRCDPSLKDHLGKAPIHYACENGHEEVVRFFTETVRSNAQIKDGNGNTPLHIAAQNGQLEVVKFLTHHQCRYDGSLLHNTACGGPFNDVDFGCDVNITGSAGMTSLHLASLNGHLNVVKYLSSLPDCDLSCRDDMHSTPLHLAASNGHLEVIRFLVEETKFDGNFDNSLRQFPLHLASANGHIDVVKYLISFFKSFYQDNSCYDKDNFTPLHLAASNGHMAVVKCFLTSKFFLGTKHEQNKSPLYCACTSGHKEIVLELLKHGARDPRGLVFQMTLSYSELLFLIHLNSYRNIKSLNWRSMKLQDCKGEWLSNKILRGQISTVHLCNNELSNVPIELFRLPNVKEIDLSNNWIKNLPTSLWECTKLEVLNVSCNQLGSLPACLLKLSCLKVLKCSFNSLKNLSYSEKRLVFASQVDFADFSYNSLSLTALKDLFLSDIEDLELSSNMITELPEEFLESHCAHVNLSDNKLKTIPSCDNGKSSESLISSLNISGNEFSVFPKELIVAVPCLSDLDISRNLFTEVDSQFLYTMASHGRRNVVLALIEHFHVTLDDNRKQLLLHSACSGGNADLVRSLCEKINPMCIDSNGDTPLHVASALGHCECIDALLSSGAPVLLRNSSGRIPMDVATPDAKIVLENYMISNKESIYQDYDIIKKIADRTYSGSERITRIFVIGNPGAGKSTLVETLKHESWLDQSFMTVSESSVPQHTAGMIPSIYTSKLCGRLLFYDFAGDPEYYSSHAAILENVACSKKGDNIFVIVVDLRDDNRKITSIINYWTVFVRNQKFTEKNSFFIIVGSHHDLLDKDQRKEKEEELKCYHVPLFMLNCCKPRLVSKILQKINSLTQDSPCYKLTVRARVLLGLLQKDFENVVSCPIDTLISLIVTTGINLPVNSKHLKPILSELHDIGQLLIIGGFDDPDNMFIMLNIAKLTEEVHKQLFSEEAKAKISNSAFNIGIVPKDLLFPTKEKDSQEPEFSAIPAIPALPNYINKECLIQLQYCQEISRTHFEAFLLSPIVDTQHSFLFFPALCTAKKSDKSQSSFLHQDLSLEEKHSIGWLAQCASPSDYFPPRFFHVLLLRLVFKFTLSDPRFSSQECLEHSIVKNRRCTMWATGIHWLMPEGECTVELLDTSKTVVVTIQGDEENWINSFLSIINCITITMEDFCHNVEYNTFFLSTNKEDDLNEDNMFAQRDLDDLLPYPQKKQVISASGKTSSSKMLNIYKQIKAHEFEIVVSSLPQPAHPYLDSPVGCGSNEDEDFRQITQHMHDLNSKLAAHLKLSDADIKDIQERLQEPELQRQEVLKKWKNSQSNSATYGNLLKVFVDAGEKQCVESLCSLLRTKCEGGFPVNLFDGFVSSLPPNIRSHLEYHLDLDNNDEDLCEIAYHMPHWEEELAACLKLSIGDIAEIKVSHKEPELLRREALRRWKSRQMHSATYGNLLQVFVDAGHTQCAKVLCALLRKKYILSSAGHSSAMACKRKSSSANRKLLFAPNMLHLEHLKVIEKIGRDWLKVGSLLGLSNEAISNIQYDYPNDCERSCYQVFDKWLSGKGCTPITWKKLIDVLKDAERSTLAEELENFVELQSN